MIEISNAPASLMLILKHDKKQITMGAVMITQDGQILYLVCVLQNRSALASRVCADQVEQEERHRGRVVLG